MAQVATGQQGFAPTRQGSEHRRMRKPVEVFAGGQTQVLDQGVAGQSDRPDPQGLGLGQQHAEDPGMQVKIEMPIHMVQPEPGRTKPFELGQEFPAHLSLQPRHEEISESRHDGLIGEPPPRVDQSGDLRGRQDRSAADQHRMQPHPQAGIVSGHLDGLLGGLAGDHETGRSQDALPMSALDRPVGAFGDSEIVRVDDQSNGHSP